MRCRWSSALVALVFAALAAATLLRSRRYPEAWAEDRRHPVRHAFVAALPIALMLLATVAVAHGQLGVVVETAWAAGALAQLVVTLWVLGRWWNGNGTGGLAWAGVTPAQFGVGLLLWPVVTILIAVRIATQGLWPERMRPTAFIFIAPPAVVGLAALQFGAPAPVGWALCGMALFSLSWVCLQARRIAALPFGLPHWGMSFPLAALAALTLRLAPAGGPLALLAVALLALTSLLVVGLALATLRGLRNGSLRVPEPVAAIQPAATA